MVQEPRLLDQVRDRVYFHHYSIRAEQAYPGWIFHFILFHRKRHPRIISTLEVELFPLALAAEHNVATSTQNHAISAILFLYRDMQFEFIFSNSSADKPL